MTRAVAERVRPSRRPAVGIEPYGARPEHATDDDVVRYHRNFALAQRENKNRRGRADSTEELVIDRLSTYLWSNFDARPYQQVKNDIRFIVTSQLDRI